jgi:hypothetical protein
MVYKCHKCGKENEIVNQCGCDPNNMPTQPAIEKTREERMEIAKTIIGQLGGNRFSAMTGAKNFIADGEGLSFRIPGTYTKNHINVIRIFLAWDDTYSMMFENIRGAKRKIISKFEGIYNDQLLKFFTAETGLDTHL